MPTKDDLHRAMGEFLTESSQVENMMLGLVTLCQRERSMDDVFVEFMGWTLGDKIKEFKRVCNAYHFTDKQRAILDQAYAELDILRPMRNYIVHGTTYEIGKENIPAQPYRIGMTKGDYDHMGQAIAKDFEVPHAFTVERIAAVTAECVALRGKLATVLLEVIQPLVRR
jgi:hypothetical protein